MKQRLFLAIGLVVAMSFGLAGTANGAGGPIVPGPAYGPEGVAVPGGIDRYVTLFPGRRPLIARVQQDGGQVLRTRSFGQFAIPAVTLDGSAGGLSADGSTLVLVPSRSRLPRSKTTLKVVDAPRLHARDLIKLNGSFMFDAISPDGSRIYLIEYPSLPDTTRYSVRALDTRSGRLLPEPIVDPDEPPGEMRGYPLKRVASPDGRWAYTLYDGAGKHPFIHALDTVDGRAVCIDLDATPNAGSPTRLVASADASELTVTDRKRRPVALLDTQTFEVSDPVAPGDGGGFPWLVVMLAALGSAATLLTLGVRRRRHGLATGGAR